MKALTARQLKLLRFIAAYSHSEGMAPSFAEMGEHMGVSSANGVHEHVDALIRKRCAYRMPGRATRNVGLTDRGKEAVGGREHPTMCLTCGQIRASA